MTSRRGFLAGLLASGGLLATPSWASLGNPAYLAAARRADGAFRLLGLTRQGDRVFDLPLPGRGHAAAAHPFRAEAVAIARRPGTFADVINCADGTILARLQCPPGRHFTGHGAFDLSGDLLLTPENDYENGVGRVALWDRRQGYRRIGDLASGGIGPHDILRLPGTDRFVIANGGIDTHPESGRTALNLDSMRANLALLDLDGGLEVMELAPDLRLNSIRHLALRADGLLGFAMQWQGDVAEHPPLVGLWSAGGTPPPQLMQAPEPLHGAMQNYAGSIAFSGDGRQIGITSPRGGMAQFFDVANGSFLHPLQEVDICGLASSAQGFLATSGTGRILQLGEGASEPKLHALAWDNHLVPL